LVQVAADIMTREVATASPRWTLAELERVLCEKKVNGFPVVEGRTLVGVVSRFDIIRKLSVERSRAGEISDYFRRYDADEDAVLKSFLAEEQSVAVRLSAERVSDVMSPPTFVAPPDMAIRDVAALLFEHRIHRVPVVDEGRELVGIISSLDIVGLVAKGAQVA